ncbi:hypothetical protein P7C70_g9614, partial [Phenoliferia sp. Uapishka_3]
SNFLNPDADEYDHLASLEASVDFNSYTGVSAETLKSKPWFGLSGMAHYIKRGINELDLAAVYGMRSSLAHLITPGAPRHKWNWSTPTTDNMSGLRDQLGRLPPTNPSNHSATTQTALEAEAAAEELDADLDEEDAAQWTRENHAHPAASGPPLAPTAPSSAPLRPPHWEAATPAAYAFHQHMEAVGLHFKSFIVSSVCFLAHAGLARQYLAQLASFKAVPESLRPLAIPLDTTLCRYVEKVLGNWLHLITFLMLATAPDHIVDAFELPTPIPYRFSATDDARAQNPWLRLA